MENRGKQLARILSAIQILYKRKAGITAKDLCELMGTSLKTVYRDLALIETSGFPLVSENNNGTSYFKLIEGYKNNIPITFSYDELLTLYFSKHLFQTLKGTYFDEYIKSIIKKIEMRIPEESVRLLKKFDHETNLPKNKINFGKNILKDLNRAILFKKKIELTYEGTRSGKSIRKIDPYSLYHSEGMIYLIGYCHNRKEVRIFALTRIIELKILNEFFELPKDFNLNDYFDNSFKVFRGKKKKVVLFFKKEISKYIEEKILHKSEIKENSSDGILLQMNVAITPDLKNFLLGWGDKISVIEPLELKQELRDIHLKASEII